MRTNHVLASLLLLAGAPGMAIANGDHTAEADLAKAIAGRTAGAPVDCIQLHDIESTEVFDKTAILYRTIGGKIYVNRPSAGLSSLRDNDILVTKSWTPELCSVDTVDLVDQVSRFPDGFVFLNQFVPYSKAPKSAE